MNWPREYRIPVIFTAVLHGLLLVFVMGSFISSDPVFQPPQPKMVRATLVSLKEMKKKGPRQEFKAPKPKPEPEPESKPKSKPEPKPEPKSQPQKPEPKPEAKPVVKPKVEPDKPKVDEARLKQVEEEKKRKQAEAEKKRQEDEKRRKLEEEKKRLAEAAERKRREESLLSEMTDDAPQEESDPEGTESVSAESYIALIQRVVISNWSRPISARNGMQTLLKIQLVPTGDVVGVSVVKSSGDVAFDRSAIAAVEKARSFPELAELDSATFEKNFRTFILNFNPQDLRL